MKRSAERSYQLRVQQETAAARELDVSRITSEFAAAGRRDILLAGGKPKRPYPGTDVGCEGNRRTARDLPENSRVSPIIDRKKLGVQGNSVRYHIAEDH